MENAYESEPNRITFEKIASDDDTLFEVLRSWREDEIPVLTNPPRLKRVTVDLAKKLVVSSKDLAENVEFPRYDMRLTGKKARYLYVADKLYDKDAAIMRIDLERGKAESARMGQNRTVAEPVFVPRTKAIDEDRGWILAQGYDARRNENFLEIRDAQTLDFAGKSLGRRSAFSSRISWQLLSDGHAVKKVGFSNMNRPKNEFILNL